MKSMKSSVNAEDFAVALKKISVILKKSALPQTEQIRVDFRENSCRLTACNYTAWLTAEIPASGDAFSFAFAKAKSVVRACQRYKGKLEITLFQTGDKYPMLDMLCGDKGAEIQPLLGAALILKCPIVEPSQTYRACAEDVLNRVKRVMYAAEIGGDCPQRNGVHFQDSRIWCLDKCRMAVNESSDLSVREDFILPIHAMKFLKAFGKCEMEISVGRYFTEFNGGGLRMVCHLLDVSDALRVENLLPNKHGETYSVRRGQYADAIRYLSDCGHGMKRRTVRFERGNLLLMDELVKFSAALDVDGTCETAYAFDLDLMKDALEQFSGEESVHVHVSGGKAPIVLSAGANTALIMPTRL